MASTIQIEASKIKTASANLEKTAKLLGGIKEKQAMLGPEETAEMIGEVVTTLSTLAEELSGMSGGAAAPAPGATPPPKTEGGDDAPADEDMESMKNKMAAMENDIKTTVSYINSQRKEKLASEYAALFVDQKAREKAAKDILESKDDLSTLEVRVKEAKNQRDAMLGSRSRNASMPGRLERLHQEGGNLQRDASMGDNNPRNIVLRGR